MAQGVQPEGQNVVGGSGRGCGMTCPSLMHKTNHDYRTDLFEPSGWPGTRPWKSWWQASFWLFPVCLAARKKGLGTQRLPGRELHRDSIPEGHKGYSSHPNTTRRHFGEKLGPPGLAWSFHGLHAAHLAKVLWEPARFSYSL